MEDAEDELVSLLRCPMCESFIHKADAADVRIALCGHVYHKDPHNCWKELMSGAAPGEKPACKSCKHNVY